MSLGSIIVLLIIAYVIYIVWDPIGTYKSRSVQNCLFEATAVESSIAQFAKLCYQLVRCTPKKDQNHINIVVFVEGGHVEFHYYTTSENRNLRDLIVAGKYAERLGWEVSPATLHYKKYGLPIERSWIGQPVAPRVIKAFQSGCSNAIATSGNDPTNTEAACVKFKIQI